MSEYENALNRIDDELHGMNYELYVYLHNVISQAINDIEAANARADAERENLLELYHATNWLMVCLGAHGEIDTAGALCTRVLNALGRIENGHALEDKSHDKYPK